MAKKATTRKSTKASGGAGTPAPRDLLGEAVAARASNVPMMATETEMSALVSDPRGPLVEFNNTVRDGDKIAYRATELGMQVHSQPQQPQNTASTGWGAPAPQAQQGGFQPPPPSQQPAPQQTQQPTGNFQFDTGIPVPAARRGGRGTSTYGFEQMNVGQSFFIAETPDNPNPAKGIASTVSTASRRLEPKKFIVRTVDENGRKGARVWRTE